MQKRKGLADKLSAAVDEFVDVDSDDDINDSREVSIDNSVNVDRNVSIKNGINESINDSKDVSINVSTNGNIVIKKGQGSEVVERFSTYLKPSTVKKIKKAAKQSNMKIAPFLQKLFDEILDKIKIEE